MDTFWKVVKADFRAYSTLNPSFRNIAIVMVRERGFHYVFWLRMLQFKRLKLVSIVMHRVLSTLYGIQISSQSQIGKGFHIVHAISIVVHKKAVIGENCSIHQNTTIGIEHDGVPIIGNNVMIGACSSVLGGVNIGDNVKIGAGAVVVNNIPDNCTVVGVPAKIVKTL